MSADPVVVAGVARTAIGKFAGSFKELPTSDLGAAAIKAAVTRAGISPEAVDEVIATRTLAWSPSTSSAPSTAGNA